MLGYRELRTIVAVGVFMTHFAALAQAAAPNELAAQRDELQSAIVKGDTPRAAALIRSGMELNFNFDDLLPRQRTYESPLTMAIFRGRLDIARLLLDAGADASRRDGSGQTPVHRAKSAEAIRLLIRFGADPNAQDSTGRTAVAQAVERGDLQALDMLVANGARLDAPVKGSDLITRAIELRHPELIGPLLERGADPRSPPTKALWLLIESGDVERSRLLIRRGADVNAHNGRESLLSRALFRQRWEIVQELIDAGANVRSPDAVQLARLASFNPGLLAKLVTKGLDLNAIGADGHSALTSLIVEQPMAIRMVGGGNVAIAAQNASTGKVTTRTVVSPTPVREIPAPDNVARAKALLDLGADPNNRYRDQTPLMLAIGIPGKPDGFADALINVGARIEYEATIARVERSAVFRGEVPGMAGSDPGRYMSDQRQGVLIGMTLGPLTWTALHQRPDIALRLLQRDKKLSPADHYLLYFAADLGYWDLVIGALPHSRDVNISNRANVTPLMLAADAGSVDAVRALVLAGAKVNARSARDWPPLLEKDLAFFFAWHGPAKPRLVGGYTALRAAKERGHAEVAKILIEAGGKE